MGLCKQPFCIVTLSSCCYLIHCPYKSVDYSALTQMKKYDRAELHLHTFDFNILRPGELVE